MRVIMSSVVQRLIDWVEVLRLTGHSMGHFGDATASQSLGLH